MQLKTRKGKRYAIRQGHFAKILEGQFKDREAKRIMAALMRQNNISLESGK